MIQRMVRAASASACIVLAITCVGPAQAETLKLANGDVLNCDIIEWGVDSVLIEHPQLGQVRLSLDQLDIDTGERPNSGLFGTRFMHGWKRTLDLGITGKEGNNISTNITAGFDFSYSDEFKRWAWNGRYFLIRDESGVTDNYAIMNLRRDWLFPGSRWFGRLSFRYQFDQFESWKHRTVSTMAPGYHIVQREHHTLDGLVGLTFTREFGERDSNKGEILFGVDYDWKPAERYTLSFSNNFYLEVVPEQGDWRNLTNLDLTFSLLKDPALSFKAGIQNEYESRVESGDRKNDLKYFTSLGLDF